MRKATFPIMGKYTEAFAWLVEQLGFEPIIPPKTNQQTIKLGVRHSSDMICFPFKSTLGNLIQGLEAGADVIIATDLMCNKHPEMCRFGFYYRIQEQILRRLGYKFEMIYIRWEVLSLLRTMVKINKKLNYYTSFKILIDTYKKIKDIDKREYTFEKSDVNIGLIGEAYTLWENSVNYDIVRKLRKLKCGVDMSISLSWFIKHKLGIIKYDKKIEKETKKYLPKRTGGHGFESVYNTIKYAKEGFDGVIHLLPLSCMPETMVEIVINMVSKDYDIPVYRFPIDENRFEAGFDTRLETFIKLLRRNKESRDRCI